MTGKRRPTPGPPHPGCTLCGHWAPGGLRKVGPASRHWAASHGRGSVNGGWGLGHRGQGRAPRAARQLRPGPHRPHGRTPGRGGARPEYLQAGGRRSEGCTCVSVCPRRMGGGGGQGVAPGAGAARRAGRGRGTHLGGWRGREPGVPAPAAGGSARRLPAGRCAGEAPRTDGREAAAAARARLSRALSRRCRIAGRRCRRRRRAGGRRAAQCGPGRAGPLDRPPPPLVRAAGLRRRLLATALHHCYVTGRRAGHPGGPAEKLGETCGRTGGGAAMGASGAGLPETRVAGGEGLPAPGGWPPAPGGPLGLRCLRSASLCSHSGARAPLSVTLLGTPRDVFHVPFALTLCDLGDDLRDCFPGTARGGGRGCDP